MSEVRQRIQRLVDDHEVVLFMKGNRMAPRCGFSATVVEILDEYLDGYETVDVLADPDIRQGVKDFSQWPTIPQLYVKGQFVGGCDIVREMRESGELDEVLGRKPAEATPLEITVTPAAAEALARFWESDGPRRPEGGGVPTAERPKAGSAPRQMRGKPTVRLEIDRMFQQGLDFDEPRPGDVTVDAGAVAVVLDRGSARRAQGVRIDYVDRDGESGFSIENPNEPPRVRQLAPVELGAWLDEGKKVELFDVRTPEERAKAALPGSRLLDREGMAHLTSLSRDACVVFYCHTGVRSHVAAEQAVRMGYTDVYNLRGGIDAFSQEVDASIPRY